MNRLNFNKQIKFFITNILYILIMIKNRYRILKNLLIKE